MAIPAKPEFTELPTAPTRTTPRADWPRIADAFVAALEPLRLELVAGIDWMEVVFTEVDEAAAAAAQARADALAAVEAAEGHATTAGERANLAGEHAATAEAAAAAAQSGAGLPALAGRGGLPLVVTPDESGVAFSGSLRRYDLAESSTTGALDLATGCVFELDASTPRTVTFANAPAAGRAQPVVLDITGSAGAITWPSGVTWDGGEPPELFGTWTQVTLRFGSSAIRGFVTGGAD